MQIYQNIWILFLVASILIQGLKYFESPFTKKKKKIRSDLSSGAAACYRCWQVVSESLKSLNHPFNQFVIWLSDLQSNTPLK